VLLSLPYHFFLLPDHIGDRVKLYAFFEENTKIVKDHYESQYAWKKEVKEVLEIKLRNPLLTDKEKGFILSSLEKTHFVSLFLCFLDDLNDQL
jgi:hypothetical protein